MPGSSLMHNESPHQGQGSGHILFFPVGPSDCLLQTLVNITPPTV